MIVGPDFEIDVSARGDLPVLTIRGELDMASAPQLEEALVDFEEGSVAVDLRGATFMDSTGLRVLLGARSRLVESGGSLILVYGDGPVQRVLDITGVKSGFLTYGSLAEIP